MLVNVHATYPVTRKAEGVKMGQGKGAIDHFVARVPAGKLQFRIKELLKPPPPIHRAEFLLPFPLAFMFVLTPGS